MKKQIRIVVIGQSEKIPQWTYDTLEEILAMEEVDLVGYLICEDNSAKTSFAYTIYDQLENRFFSVYPDAQAERSVKDLIASENISYFKESETNLNHREELLQTDLIIKTNFTLPEPPVAMKAPLGTLGLRMGSLKYPTSSIPAVREVFNGADTIEAHLLWQTPEGSLKDLSSVKVHTDKVSVRRSANNLLWTASSMLPRVMKKLTKGRDLKSAEALELDMTSLQKIWRPGPLKVVWFFLRTYASKIKQMVVQRFLMNQWILLYAWEHQHPAKGVDPRNFSALIPPNDRFWADPFLYEYQGDYYVFLEELVYKDRKGHLAVMTIKEDGTYTTPQTILKKEYHLSYPYLFEEDGQLYMIPETSENKCIELYRCTDFPLVWEYEMNLMDNVVAVDTSIIKHGDYYWMFTNLQEKPGGSKDNELFLFYSDSFPSRQWYPHQNNPIVSDVTQARPAGAIFEHDGVLYRPSQNCGKHYGYAFSLHEITILSPEDYQEKTQIETLPNWEKNIISTHTINQKNKLTIIDGILRKKK